MSIAGEASARSDFNAQNGRVGSTVRASLISLGYSADMAGKYALLATEVHKWLVEHKDTIDALKALKDAKKVHDGAKKVFTSAPYIKGAEALGLSSDGFAKYSMKGATAVLQVFVKYFEDLAKSLGIELNACAMAISKMAMSIAGAGAGAVTAVTGVGLVVLAFSVVGTLKSGYEVGEACIMAR